MSARSKGVAIRIIPVTPTTWACSKYKAQTRDEYGVQCELFGKKPPQFELLPKTTSDLARRRAIITNVDIVPADGKKIEVGAFVYGKYAKPNPGNPIKHVTLFFGEVKGFKKDERGRVKAIDIQITHEGGSDFTLRKSLKSRIEDGEFRFDGSIGHLPLLPFQHERLNRCRAETQTVSLKDLIALEPVIVAVRNVDRVVHVRSPRVVRTKIDSGDPQTIKQTTTGET